MPLDGVFGALYDGHTISTDAPTTTAPAGEGATPCGARPIHAHLDLSPGLDFGAPLAFKPDMAAALERALAQGALSRPDGTPQPVLLGADTDPYQPVERTLRLTRATLDVLERFGHPVSIATRSTGVLRDLDPLKGLAARGLVRVWFPIATLDAALARTMEPRADAPTRRLQAAAALGAAGVPVGVLAAPMIPGLNDAEMERILDAASRAGVRQAGYALLRPPHEVQDRLAAWLREHFPERARHVLALIRETRTAALAEDHLTRRRFPGAATYPDALAQRFLRVTRRLGLQGHNTLDIGRVAPPVARAEPQLSPS